MTVAHAIIEAAFAGCIPFCLWLIARDLRREWRRVGSTFGAPPASGAFSATMEATSRPTAASPRDRGALGEAR